MCRLSLYNPWADPVLREERLRDAEAGLARLRRRDPGGDITL